MDWLPVNVELDSTGVFTSISPDGVSPSIMLRANQIRSERTGIHAMVAVWHGSTRLAYDTFNVSRNEERARLAKDAHAGLNALAQTAYPRAHLKQDLDDFCPEIWPAWQEREPAVEIMTDIDEKPKPPAWLLEPLVLANQPNALFGERSSIKSLTALVVATTGLIQWKDNPLHIPPPEAYFESLYLDFERNEAMARYNLVRLQRGMGLSALFIHYKRLHGTLTRNADWVRHYLQGHPKIKMVVVDSITPACGGNLNETGPASDFFEAERSLNTTTFCLAHTSKDIDAKRKTIAGSFAFESYTGNIFECRKEQDEESSTAEVCLYHRKPPAVYRLRKPLAYRITFDEQNHSLTTAWLDPKSIEGFVERMTLNTRILQLLNRGEATTKEVADRLEEKLNTVSVAISRLRSNGAVVETRKESRISYWGRSLS